MPGPPPLGPSGTARLDRVVLAAIALVGLYSLATCARGIEYFLAQGADDAAYYLKIAENAAHGRGFSFDGLAPTNGFHPLWAWTLVGLHRCVDLPPEGMVRLVWALQSVLMTAAAFLLWRLLRSVAGAWPAALGTVLFVGRLYYTGRGGMESALLLLLAIALLGLAARWRPEGVARPLAFGALAGLVMLARLDSVFVVGCVCAGWCLTAPGWPQRLRAAAFVLAAASAVELPYLASNLRDFGHLLPISGALKSSFPRAGWHWDQFSVRGQDLLMLLAALAACVALLGARLAGRLPRDVFHRTLLPAVALGLLLHAAYSSFFMRWGVFSWHFVLERLGLSLAVPVLAAMLVPPERARADRLWTALLVVVALGSLAPVARRDLRRDYSLGWTVQAYRAAQWAQAHTPPDAVFAMKDAGNFGYYSRRRVVNLDGLVNTWAYQDSLGAGRLEGFLRSRGVQYFVQHAIYERPDILDGTYERFRFELWSHRHGRPGGSLELRAEDEVYRSVPFTDAGHPTVFLIWRMPHP